MIVFRTIAAVFIGYLFYGVSSMLLVGVVMASNGIFSVVAGLIGLSLIAFLCGLSTVYMAHTKSRLAASIVAGLIIAATGANLYFQLGMEPPWYKVATLSIVAPGIMLTAFIARSETSIDETASQGSNRSLD